LCCLFVLSGCKDAEKEKALADAKAAETALARVQAELETVKARLDAVEKERDSLKANSNELSASIGSLKTQFASVTDVRDKLQGAADQVKDLKDQMTQLVQDKESALAKAAGAELAVEKLTKDLQDQIQRVASLQEQNTKLQQAMEELKKLGNAIKIP